MIEEQGTVVALDEKAVWVEVVRTSSCASCSAKAGCGQGLAQSLAFKQKKNSVRALTPLQLSVGDMVTIGVPERMLVASSIMVYLLPLLSLLAFATLGHLLALSEPAIIGLSILGFSLSLLAVRYYAQHYANSDAMQPVVLRVQLMAQQL